jgi:hypothetical protein
VRTDAQEHQIVQFLSRYGAKVQRFSTGSRAEAQDNLTVPAPFVHCIRLEVADMTKLKLSLIPYAAALTTIATLSGYITTR